MKTANLKKKVKRLCFFLIFWAFLNIVSVPVMILSIVQGDQFWLLAAPCIAIVASALFIHPICWPLWADMRDSKNILIAITEDGITNVDELTRVFGKNHQNIRKIITGLMSKRYLTGYVLSPDGKNLILREKKTEQKTQRAKCEFCGAPLPLDAKICLHCNSVQ